RYLLQINEYNIPVKNLPPAFNNFEIIHLTDLHYGMLMPKIFIEQIIDKANSIDGDSIVCTGDYVLGGGDGSQIETVWSLLKKLKAKSGVYSVLGNHDHWADSDKSLKSLNDSGHNVRHQAVALERNGERIWIGGAGDLWDDEVGIDKAFKEVPNKECKILLAHNPDTADSKFSTRVDLMISGHTHGGQVNIPFIGAPVLPVKNKNYSSGFIRSQNTNIFISRGIGWAIVPVRFNCYPEIAVLKLIKA
ncbi:MAG: metallophosphoesterase, partial [Nitrospirae bacterium]|nr:metallophosphoesterase [Nitrospirota bacterium]